MLFRGPPLATVEDIDPALPLRTLNYSLIWGTYSLHCSSFLGLPFRILNIELVKPKKGTTMETIGNAGFTSSTVGKPWFSSGLRLVIQGVGTFYGVVGFRV